MDKESSKKVIEVLNQIKTNLNSMRTQLMGDPDLIFFCENIFNAEFDIVHAIREIKILDKEQI